MEEDTVVGLPRPGGTVEDDPLLGALRAGARQMLSHAIKAEVAASPAAHADRVDDQGRRRLVRNDHAPTRTLQTGIGGIEVQRPRVRDLGAGDAARVRFTSAVLPDRAALLVFHDFPAEHWKHVRSTNPIESTLATVRPRADKTKGCLSRATALALVFEFAK